MNMTNPEQKWFHDLCIVPIFLNSSTSAAQIVKKEAEQMLCLFSLMQYVA